MNILSLIFIIATAILAVVLCVVAEKYYRISAKYYQLQDETDYIEEYVSNENADNMKLLSVMGEQYENTMKLLFEIILNILGEKDEGVAVNRLIELRYNATTLSESNSPYVRETDTLVNHGFKRDIDAVMCWLCSVFDVRDGKAELSAGTELTYNALKVKIITAQKKILQRRYEIEQLQQEENNYDEQNEEEDREEDREGSSEASDQEEYPEEYEEEYFPLTESKNPFSNFAKGFATLFKGYSD